MKVEILSNNISLDGKTYLKGETAEITKDEFDIVKKMDKDADRDFRLKTISKPKKSDTIAKKLSPKKSKK